MKARVTREYIDKHTQEFHAVGEEISLTVERFAEIEKAGPYVVVIEQSGPDEQLDAVPETHTNDQGQKQPGEAAIGIQSETEQDEPVEEPKTEKVKKTRRNRK